MKTFEMPHGISYHVEARQFATEEEARQQFRAGHKTIMDGARDASIWTTAQKDRETGEVGPWFVVFASQHEDRMEAVRAILTERLTGTLADDIVGDEMLHAFALRRLDVAMEAVLDGETGEVKREEHYEDHSTAITRSGQLRDIEREEG